MASNPAYAALEAVGFSPCGDNSCIFGAPGGMATNGGCRCFDKMHGWPETARASLRLIIAALRAAVIDQPLGPSDGEVREMDRRRAEATPLPTEPLPSDVGPMPTDRAIALWVTALLERCGIATITWGSGKTAMVDVPSKYATAISNMNLAMVMLARGEGLPKFMPKSEPAKKPRKKKVTP